MTDYQRREATLATIALVEAYRADDPEALESLLGYRPGWLLTAVLAKELAAVLADAHGDGLTAHLADARATLLAEVTQ